MRMLVRSLPSWAWEAYSWRRARLLGWARKMALDLADGCGGEPHPRVEDGVAGLQALGGLCADGGPLQRLALLVLLGLERFFDDLRASDTLDRGGQAGRRGGRLVGSGGRGDGLSRGLGLNRLGLSGNRLGLRRRLGLSSGLGLHGLDSGLGQRGLDSGLGLRGVRRGLLDSGLGLRGLVGRDSRPRVVRLGSRLSAATTAQVGERGEERAAVALGGRRAATTLAGRCGRLLRRQRLDRLRDAEDPRTEGGLLDIGRDRRRRRKIGARIGRLGGRLVGGRLGGRLVGGRLGRWGVPVRLGVAGGLARRGLLGRGRTRDSLLYRLLRLRGRYLHRGF